MTRLYLIGLTGKPGAGKDSCAEALRAHGYQTIAFADALRAEVAQAWRIDQRMLSDRATKEWPLPALAIGMCSDPHFLHWAVHREHSLQEPRSARWIMQHWGTEYRRAQDEDYWVRVVQRWARQRVGLGNNHLAVTDVRMRNEAALIHALGGSVVRVHRPELASVLSAATVGHDSEAQARQIDADGVIHNDAGLDALPAEVARVAAWLMGEGALGNAVQP
jgi:hypothetical protein